MAGWVENRALLSLLTRKSRTWGLWWAGAAEMAVAQPGTLWAPESSSTVSSAPLVKEGTSLTAVTVISKVWMAEVSTPPLRSEERWVGSDVTVAGPFWSAGGV